MSTEKDVEPSDDRPCTVLSNQSQTADAVYVFSNALLEQTLIEYLNYQDIGRLCCVNLYLNTMLRLQRQIARCLFFKSKWNADPELGGFRTTVHRTSYQPIVEQGNKKAKILWWRQIPDYQ